MVFPCVNEDFGWILTHTAWEEFLRIGGGNLNGILPGTNYKWNETVGALENRPGKVSVWGYYETDGTGLVELMHMCEDLEIEPSKYTNKHTQLDGVWYLTWVYYPVFGLGSIMLVVL